MWISLNVGPFLNALFSYHNIMSVEVTVVIAV